MQSRVLLLVGASVLFGLSRPIQLQAASKTVPAKSTVSASDYASALAAADRFLQAWQAGDAENGMVLLTGHAREKLSPEDLETFFSASAPAAYEISRGKPLRPGRYEFPVMLLGRSSAVSTAKTSHLHRRFSNLVVLRTGDNDWAIDKLP